MCRPFSKAIHAPHFQTRQDTKKAPAFLCKCLNHKGLSRPFPWSHLGLNQGPPDYESGATNQLSYGTVYSFLSGNSSVGLRILCRSFTQVNSLLRRLSALDLDRNKLRLVLKSGQFQRWTEIDFAFERTLICELSGTNRTTLQI